MAILNHNIKSSSVLRIWLISSTVKSSCSVESTVRPSTMSLVHRHRSMYSAFAVAIVFGSIRVIAINVRWGSRCTPYMVQGSSTSKMSSYRPSNVFSLHWMEYSSVADEGGTSTAMATVVVSSTVLSVSPVEFRLESIKGSSSTIISFWTSGSGKLSSCWSKDSSFLFLDLEIETSTFWRVNLWNMKNSKIPQQYIYFGQILFGRSWPSVEDCLQITWWHSIRKQHGFESRYLMYFTVYGVAPVQRNVAFIKM